MRFLAFQWTQAMPKKGASYSWEGWRLPYF